MAFKNVLIVEDELIISLMLEQMVLRMGHKVSGKVTSGEMAVVMAKEVQPDIILMDIRLQGSIDGIEAITEIQKEMSLSVIYITGNTDEMNKKRIETTEYLDFLVKPITQNQLSTSFSLAC